MTITNFKLHLADLFKHALSSVAPELADGMDVVLERTKQAQHGDYACNLAMQLAKPLRRSPRDIAQALIAALPTSSVIDKVEIAGAGFINVFITATAKQDVVHGVLQSGEAYGRSTLGGGRKLQVEFVVFGIAKRPIGKGIVQQPEQIALGFFELHYHLLAQAGGIVCTGQLAGGLNGTGMGLRINCPGKNAGHQLVFE